MSHPIHTATVWTQPATDADGFLPEGPQEVSLNGKPMLGWVNIQTAPDATSGAIWLRDAATGELTSRTPPGRPGFFRPTTIPNVVLVGLTKQIGLFDLNTSAWEPLAEIPDANPRTIINDAEVTPDGKYVVFGTKDTQFKDYIAHLYLFDPSTNAIHVLADGQMCSNGKIIYAAVDGYTLYDIDTPTRQVKQFRLSVDAPRLEYVRTPLDLSTAIGFPDGMADLGNGAALVAFYNPDPAPYGLAIAYDLKSGNVREEWRFPGSPRVTCPLLTEQNGIPTAFFTTATEGMPAEMRSGAPDAGCIFTAPVNVTAVPKPVLLKMKRQGH